MARPKQSAPGHYATGGGRAHRTPPAVQSSQDAETRCRSPSPSRQDSHLLAAGALRRPTPVGSDRLSRSPRLTDPDPNPRRGRPAPPESHCACVTRARAPPPVHAPSTPVTRQRGRRRLRRRRRRPRLPNAPHPPLSEARAPTSFPVILFAPSSVGSGFLLGRFLGRVLFL